MHKKFNSVGFDLDNTLYKTTPEINKRIHEYACRKASALLEKPYEEFKQRFDEEYKRTQSGSSSLIAIGFQKGKELMQEALEISEIALLLQKDSALVNLISRLEKKYQLFLITSSPRTTALQKLDALGINYFCFHPIIFGESHYLRTNGSAFKYIASVHEISFEKMFFVGDRENTDILPARELGVTTAIVNAKSKAAHYHLNEIYDLKDILLK